MHRALALLVLLLALPVSGAGTRARRRSPNELLRVAAPVHKQVASAHPFVNLVVRFGTGAGIVIDAGSFRARIGRVDITDRFQPVVENGTVTGMRAAVGPPLVRVGKGANQLRFSIRGTDGGKPRKDVDRVRFRAAEGPNHPPVARLAGANGLLFPDTPMAFDGSQSYDPDGDALSFQWDFGDGTTATDPKPTHIYGVQSTDVTVGLTVSDSIVAASETGVLFAAPAIDPGRTVGQLSVEASQTLEFGAIAPGSDATRVFTVRNTDPTPTSQVKVRIGLEGTGFAVEPAEIALDPGASSPITLRFAPGATGHQMGMLTAVASSQRGGVVHLLAHGYGGEAPDNGPTLAQSPLYYVDLVGQPEGVFPDGGHFSIDNAVSTCFNGNGGGSRDLCLIDQDCNVAGERCVATQSQRFDPVDMCTTGDGHLYMLSEDIFTDLTTGDEKSVGILDLALNARGARTGSSIVRHTTTETAQLACDRIADGSVYIAELRNLAGPARCFRDSREQLVAINRRNGNPDTLVQRIDAAEGFDDCNDDVDPANDLEVLPDGSAAYATFDGNFDSGGLYRIWPTPLWISSDIRDFFQIHPDGSVLYLTVANAGGLGVISLYKIAPEQAINGAVRLSDLAPCATFTIPNNGGFVQTDPDGGSFAVAPAAGGFDATVVATFTTRGGVLAAQPRLNMRGTVAFSVPATGSCSTLGLTSLDFFLYPRF